MTAQNDVPIAQKPPTAGRTKRLLVLSLVLIATVVLASAWLVFPYFVGGRTILEDVSYEVTTARSEQARTLGEMLTRIAEGPGDAEVNILYATPTYFDRTSTQRVAAQYDPDKYHVFFVNEGLHTGQLPLALPEVELIVDGVSYPAFDRDGPIETDHHRTTIVRFDRFDAAGKENITADTKNVALKLSNNWDTANTSRQVAWEMPIAYPDKDATLSSPVMIMALSAGLLSATLTPCLLQLIIVYMATLTGLSAEQMGRAGAVPADVRRKMMLVAVAFVLGFMAFYTAAGAVMGYAGKTAQLVFSDYSRPVAIGSGVLVILMGLWVGIRARAPIVCHIPAPGLMGKSDKGGLVRSVLLAMGFSLGCMVCFSGAILATLFIYVGALGSATTGALILFIFSLGVAIPFLAAAFFLSRAMTAMNWVSRYSPQLGFVSMLVIIAFGVVLLTDNFHTVSDLIYPWLGLS